MSTPLHIHITTGDDAPIYRQIVRQVVEGLASGALEPGARLPSIRDLARKLVIAPLTVKKAYDELETQGLVEARQGQGTFVRSDVRLSKEAATERLRPLARRLLLEARLGDVNAKELASILNRERAALQRERKEQEETR